MHFAIVKEPMVQFLLLGYLTALGVQRHLERQNATFGTPRHLVLVDRAGATMPKRRHPLQAP